MFIVFAAATAAACHCLMAIVCVSNAKWLFKGVCVCESEDSLSLSCVYTACNSIYMVYIVKSAFTMAFV